MYKTLVTLSLCLGFVGNVNAQTVVTGTQRLEQLDVKNPQASAYQILKKFFEESQSSLTVSAFAEARGSSDRKNGGLTCSMATDGSVRAYETDIFYVNEVRIREGVSGQGPLFPGVPPIFAKRFTIGGQVDPKWSVWEKSIFTATSKEIYQSVDLSKASADTSAVKMYLRKNGDLYTFKVIATKVGYVHAVNKTPAKTVTNDVYFYGYCY